MVIFPSRDKKTQYFTNTYKHLLHFKHVASYLGFIPSQDAQWCPFLKQENWKTLCGDRFKSRLITSWKKNRKDKSCLDNMLFSQIVQLTKRENHFLPQLLIILDIFIAIVLHNYNKCS